MFYGVNSVKCIQVEFRNLVKHFLYLPKSSIKIHLNWILFVEGKARRTWVLQTVVQHVLYNIINEFRVLILTWFNLKFQKSKLEYGLGKS